MVDSVNGLASAKAHAEAARDADVEAARGSGGTDPRSADLTLSLIGRLFPLSPAIVYPLGLRAGEVRPCSRPGPLPWWQAGSSPVVLGLLLSAPARRPWAAH